MSELGHVISSTALTTRASAAVQDGCPRELLGLSCIVSEYQCLCELVDACTIEAVKNESGGTALVTLSMTLRRGEDAQAVMAGIDLMAYKADLQVSRSAVAASFNLRRPQNAELRAFLRETGI
jgi:hypothetical protein